MKKKLFFLLSFAIVLSCATLFVACNKYNDEKLNAEKIVTVEYGNSVDFSKFNVEYYKDGETHPVELKTPENPDGFTWKQIASDNTRQLDVDKPKVGGYDLLISYKGVSKIVSLIIKPATFPETIAISADASTKYLGDKINISLSNEPEGAKIVYKFAKRIDVDEDGQESYIDLRSFTKTEYERYDKDTMFISMFHVGKYKVFAEITLEGYTPFVTEPTTFNIEKTSLKGKYYVSNQDAELYYISNRLGDYAFPNEFLLARSNTGDGLPYNLSTDEYSIGWNNPEQEVGLSTEGIPVLLKFESEDFTLLDDTDLKEVTLYIVPAEFPYATVALTVDGNILDASATVDYKTSYDLSVKVSATSRERYVDLLAEYTLTLKNANDEEIDGTYSVSETDEQNGFFDIKYEIVSKSGKYKTKADTIRVYFSKTALATSDTLQRALTFAVNNSFDYEPITVKLTENTISTETIYSVGAEGKVPNIILDLAGKTITGTIFANHQATLSITGNGTITTSFRPLIVHNQAKVTIENGTLVSTGDVALEVSGGELVVNNATVNSVEMTILVIDAGTLTVNGGTFAASDNAVVGTNGINGRGNNTITINGGTFNGGITTAGYVACGIYIANNDTLNVNAGTFNITNGAGIVARGGNITVKDGVVFNCTNDQTRPTGKVGDSRIVVPSGVEIVVDFAAHYPGLADGFELSNNTEYGVVVIVSTDADRELAQQIENCTIVEQH